MLGKRYAYRVLWEEQNGPLTRKQILHHTCEHKWCVNLEHLTPITQGQHLLEHGLEGDWGQADKTHCPAGHPYNEENTYAYVRKDGRHERHCRLCVLAAKRRYNARKRAA